MKVTDTKTQLIVQGSNCCEEFEWEKLCSAITKAMQTVKKDNREWHGEVTGFGWRRISGVSNFTAKNGEELLRGVLPNTDCVFRVYLADKNKGIMINNAHHDSPMWAEWYTISPFVEVEETDGLENENTEEENDNLEEENDNLDE